MGYSAQKSNLLYLSNYTSAPTSNTTNEELLMSLQITANNIKAGDIIEIYARFLVTNSANDKTFRLYLNTSNSLSGATLLGFSLVTAIVQSFLSRRIAIISDTSIRVPDTGTSVASEFGGVTVADDVLTVPSLSGGVWLLISGQKETGTETLTAEFLTAQVFR